MVETVNSQGDPIADFQKKTTVDFNNETKQPIVETKLHRHSLAKVDLKKNFNNILLLLKRLASVYCNIFHQYTNWD